MEFKPLYSITTWDKRFNGVGKDKQINVLKFNHVSAEELKKMNTENGDVFLLTTGNYEGNTTIDIAKNNLKDAEVIAIPFGGNPLEVPLPPIPVQEEIVRILDTFTELTKELTKELGLRKKQYAYYRDKLLTFKRL